MANEIRPLVQAIADHFEIDPEDVLNYVLIAKHKGEDDQEIFSSAWPAMAPTDSLLGLTGVLAVHVDRTVS